MDSSRKFAAHASPRWPRLLRDSSIDFTMVVGAVWLTQALATNRLVPASWPLVLVEGSLLGLIAVAVLAFRGVYSINVRYIGLSDFLNLVMASVTTMIVMGFTQAFGWPMVHAAGTLIGPVILGFMVCTGLSGVRIARRLLSWRTLSHLRDPNSAPPRRTMVIGAGDGGEAIVREIQRSRTPAHHILGFVDDDPNKANLRIHGFRVLGKTKDIPSLVQELRVEELLLAIPSAKGADVRRIMDFCNQTKARLRILPPVKSMLDGHAPMAHLREVEIEDLLRREPVKTDLQGISSYLSGERVLITGGGGSIGSELARQISNFAPANLTLLGKGENSIYEIEQELVQTNRIDPTCVIADVRDRYSMQAAFDKYKPTVVFHAAAHKHVPLMEGNPIEAIRNNVGGTWMAAEMAINHGARKFIYVSTDKAVKPSSIMGATKRVGEMIVSALGRQSETEFAIVRFGNVMGSRGSLIPLLKAQIRRGGPVRITHPEMTRYFMTIPEAVQLILQAGAIGESGEIFLLDMGEPLKIVDIATDLIRLSGLSPGQDIEMHYSGVRPGEKIHEELLYEEELLCPTKHAKIRMVKNGAGAEWIALKREIEILLDLCEQGKSEEARRCLMELAWGKTPSHEVNNLAHSKNLI